MRALYRNNREGMALAMAMFAIVVIGALIAGAFFASTQDFRIGRNSLIAQRAFTAAEFGLNKTMSGWDQTLNIKFAVGKDTTFSYNVGDGSTSTVRATRINDYTYWFVSEGTAGVGTSQEVKRRTSMVMRLAYPAVKYGGALTLAGGGTIKGSSQVYGTNANPAGWDCANYPGRDTTAVAYGPNSTLTVQKSSNAIGTPATYADPNAGTDGTYVKYGDESWTTLVNNADIKLNGDPGTVLPALNANGTCNTSLTTNWGEPLRGTGAVTACQTYMPIIYVSTDVHLNQGRGQGVLLVDGSLYVNGSFDWYGLIIVRDQFTKANGSANIVGAAMARNASISATTNDILGNVTFQYSKCAVEMALRGSARLVPARQRAWAEMW
jgi:Tfp pilus assembly protein PilX